MAVGGMGVFLSWLMFGWFRHWLTTFALVLTYRYDMTDTSLNAAIFLDVLGLNYSLFLSTDQCFN